MKILFVVPGPISWATSRFRAYWLQPYIPHSEVIQFQPFVALPFQMRMALVDKFDAVVWLKHVDLHVVEMTPLKIHTWDVTDPMWWFSDQEDIEQIIRAVTAVSTSSPALAEDLRLWAAHRMPDVPSDSMRVTCLPDRMDLQHYTHVRQHENSNPVRFIWFGLAVNRFSLFGGIALLQRLQAEDHPVILTVMDNQPETWQGLPTNVLVKHVAWDLDRESEILAQHDIALLPPYPGMWGRVKSNNKKLTAWAAGLPYVDGEEYYEARRLVTDWELRRDTGLAARRDLERLWTSDHGAMMLVSFLEGMHQ